MHTKIFKKLSIDNCYINTMQFSIYDITIPANCVIYNDISESTLYICPHFPDYAGKPENVNLRVIWYDYEMHTIGDTFLKNCDISIALFNAWINASKPHTRKIRHEITMRDYEKMMDHPRKNKRGTGGVRLSEKTDEYTTDAVRYKQVTECAYWANLNNSKSGNASVVASSIR